MDVKRGAAGSIDMMASLTLQVLCICYNSVLFCLEVRPFVGPFCIPETIFLFRGWVGGHEVGRGVWSSRTSDSTLLQTITYCCHSLQLAVGDTLLVAIHCSAAFCALFIDWSFAEFYKPAVFVVLARCVTEVHQSISGGGGGIALLLSL